MKGISAKSLAVMLTSFAMSASTHVSAQVARESLVPHAESREAQLSDWQTPTAGQKGAQRKQGSETSASQAFGLLATNTFVALSFGAGEIVHFDSQGIILKDEDHLLPRTSWDAITERDAGLLLRTPKVFEGATVLGPLSRLTNA